MNLFIKICGLTSDAAVSACAEAGVEAVGFVFARSPRRVVPETAARLAMGLPESVLKVAVFNRPEPGEVEVALQVFPADVVQADHDVLMEVAAPALLPVFREGSDSIPQPGRRFLYEGRVSGVGVSVNRDIASRLAERGEMVLAGGLDPDSVFDAIETVRPFGIDVSSGVESQPGVKDPERIRAFVAAARSAAERLVRV